MIKTLRIKVPLPDSAPMRSNQNQRSIAIERNSRRLLFRRPPQESARNGRLIGIGQVRENAKIANPKRQVSMSPCHHREEIGIARFIAPTYHSKPACDY
jgi:hypothetical protein